MTLKVDSDATRAVGSRPQEIVTQGSTGTEKTKKNSDIERLFQLQGADDAKDDLSVSSPCFADKPEAEVVTQEAPPALPEDLIPNDLKEPRAIADYLEQATDNGIYPSTTEILTTVQQSNDPDRALQAVTTTLRGQGELGALRASEVEKRSEIATLEATKAGLPVDSPEAKEAAKRIQQLNKEIDETIYNKDGSKGAAVDEKVLKRSEFPELVAKKTHSQPASNSTAYLSQIDTLLEQGRLPSLNDIVDSLPQGLSSQRKQLLLEMVSERLGETKTPEAKIRSEQIKLIAQREQLLEENAAAFEALPSGNLSSPEAKTFFEKRNTARSALSDVANDFNAIRTADSSNGGRVSIQIELPGDSPPMGLPGGQGLFLGGGLDANSFLTNFLQGFLSVMSLLLGQNRPPTTTQNTQNSFFF